MPYLFDTDALSEVLRPRPAERFVAWLATVPAEEQATSAVSIGEPYRGAFRSPNRRRWLDRIDRELLPRLVVLPFDAPTARIYGEIRARNADGEVPPDADAPTARIYGEIRARLEADGRMPGEADLQIAATALHHGLSVVTGNVRHFERVPGLRIERVLADSRSR